MSVHPVLGLQRHVPAPRDDHVVEHLDSHDAPRLDEPASELDVLLAGGRVPGWVVVGQDQRRCALLHGRLEVLVCREMSCWYLKTTHIHEQPKLVNGNESQILAELKLVSAKLDRLERTNTLLGVIARRLPKDGEPPQTGDGGNTA